MDRQQIIIHELITWIDTHITQRLKIDDVAQRAGYSRWHLQRMFLRVMNISLGQYIRDKKLESAAQELLLTDDTVMEIAIRYGYDSQQTFTHSFVRKYQVPPGVYRRAKALNYYQLN